MVLLTFVKRLWLEGGNFDISLKSNFPISSVNYLLNPSNFHPLRELYVKPDGSLYHEGDMMTSPRLADTLQLIADHGPEVFYTGTLADDIVSDIQDCGKILGWTFQGGVSHPVIRAL